MLVLAGAAQRSTLVSVAPDRAWDVVANFVDLFAALPDVLSVERYPQDVVRVILKRIGAMGYGLHIAYDLQLSLEPQHRLVARSLPFDPEDAWIGDGILLARYASETRLDPHAEGTSLVHDMDVEVTLRMPTVLRFAPPQLVKATGDALMQQKLAYFADQMTRLFREALT